MSSLQVSEVMKRATPAWLSFDLYLYLTRRTARREFWATLKA